MEKQLSQNLILQSVSTNNWKHDSHDREIVTSFELQFTFFGIGGFSAYVNDTALAHDCADFKYIESEQGDLHESFTDEIDKYWKEIVASCQKFAKQHFEEECKLVGCFD